MARNSIIDDFSNTPLDYALRVSRKARYARLQIKPYRGLEVIIPLRFPRNAVADLVYQHRDWIRQQLSRHQQQFRQPVLSGEIFLPISGLTTSIVDVISAEDGIDGNLQTLRQWVRKQAWQTLPPMLQEVSEVCRLSYRKLSIRSQKTRWGSCSSKGTISLNDQLVFVPAATVRYLMIHELCHTRHMNHSRPFWQLVENHCPDYRQHERVLNQARRDVPDWYQYSLYA